MNKFKFFIGQITTGPYNTLTSAPEIRQVAVMCRSIGDFNRWKSNYFGVLDDEYDLEDRFIRYRVRYVAIRGIDCVRGERFDDIIYTDSDYRDLLNNISRIFR